MSWTEITRSKYRRDGLRYASDATDEEWALIEPHMPVRTGSICPRKLPMVVLVVVLTAIVAAMATAGEEHTGKSLLELRQENVIVQKWDLSCGAAALATLLNYQHGDRVTEREVAKGLFTRREYLDDPDRVHRQEGFSLLDLKRIANERGYEGVTYGGMQFENLIERAPLIVPINALDYNHFVIFRGVMGDRVLLADPAYGNRTMPIYSTY